MPISKLVPLDDIPDNLVPQSDLPENVDQVPNYAKSMQLQGGIEQNVFADVGESALSGLSTVPRAAGQFANQYLRPLIGKEPLTQEQFQQVIKPFGAASYKPKTWQGGVAEFGGELAPTLLIKAVGAIPQMLLGGGIGATQALSEGKSPLGVLGSTALGAATSLAGTGVEKGIGAIKGLGGRIGDTIVKNAGLNAESYKKIINPNINTYNVVKELNTPEKISQAYQGISSNLVKNLSEIKKNLGEAVGEAKKTLPSDVNINVNPYIEQFKKSDKFNKFISKKGDFIKDPFAKTTKGKLGSVIDSMEEHGKNPKYIVKSGLSPSALGLSYGKPLLKSIATKGEDLQHKDIAYEILSQATGKNKKWLKSQLESSKESSIGNLKRKDYIARLVSNTEDKLLGNETPVWNKYFAGYDLESVQGGTDMAEEALRRIEQKDWRLPEDLASKLFNEQGMALKQEFNKHSFNVINNLTKSKSLDEGYVNAFDYIEKKVPEYLQEDIMKILGSKYDKLSKPIDKIIKNKRFNEVVKGRSLKDIVKKSTGGKIPANKLAEDFLSKIDASIEYDKLGDTSLDRELQQIALAKLRRPISKALGNLSPAYKEANLKYTFMERLFDKKGLSSLKNSLMHGENVNIDNVTSFLKQNTGVLKGGRDSDLASVENFLRKYNKNSNFRADIQDISISNEILNAVRTGLGFNLPGIGRIDGNTLRDLVLMPVAGKIRNPKSILNTKIIPAIKISEKIRRNIPTGIAPTLTTRDYSQGK